MAVNGGASPRAAPRCRLTMTEWPKYLRARDLVAGGHIPVSEDVLLQLARKHGVGRKMGRTVIFSAADIERLYEVLPCPSGLSADRTRQIGSCAGLSAEFALKKALALATNEPRRRSGQS